MAQNGQSSLMVQNGSNGPNFKMVTIVKISKWTKMVENEPNFKTLEITQSTKVLKMSIIVKLPQSDQNLKMG